MWWLTFDRYLCGGKCKVENLGDARNRCCREIGAASRIMTFDGSIERILWRGILDKNVIGIVPYCFVFGDAMNLPVRYYVVPGRMLYRNSDGIISYPVTQLTLRHAIISYPMMICRTQWCYIVPLCRTRWCNVVMTSVQDTPLHVCMGMLRHKKEVIINWLLQRLSRESFCAI